MGKQSKPVFLSPEDDRILREWIRCAEEQLLRAERARIIILASERYSTQQIARALGIRSARVSKWRTRFAAAGLAGLESLAKPGKPRQYDETIDNRILALVDQPPPGSERVWNGPLLAQVLGNVSVDYVWKVLRKHGIKLRKHNPLDVETRAFVVARSVMLLGLYLSGKACAFLIGTSDGGSLPAGNQGFVRAPSLEAASKLRESGGSRALTLLDVLRWAAGLAERHGYSGRSLYTLEAFLSEARSWQTGGEVHAFVVGTPARGHPELHVHTLLTFGAFREQFRSWLSILTEGSRLQASGEVSGFATAVESFVAAQTAGSQAAFEWHSRGSFGTVVQRLPAGAT